MRGVNDWGFLPNPWNRRPYPIEVDEPLDKVVGVEDGPIDDKFIRDMQEIWDEYYA